MDESHGARQRHIKPSDISEDTCNILAVGQDSLPKGTPQSAIRRSKSRDPGRDPEATNRIGESPGRSRELRRERTTPQVTAGRFRNDVRILDISSHSAPNEVPSLVPVADPEPLSVGTELDGRYVIVEDGSESNMALVYKAFDRQRELAGDESPYVALKAARHVDQAENELRQHLREEFLKLSKLHHPGIVAAYDLCVWRDTEFLVLEWLDGETLADRLDGLSARRLSLQTARTIIGDVAAALAHAHDAGVVHGDVKPSNIFLTDDHQTKLFDFGATTSATAEVDNPRQQWATQAYASCGVLSGETPTPADDVFALGVTAYRLLTGERPFGDADAETAKSGGLVPAELPEDAAIHWPAIRSALAFDAVDRPKNASEFLELFWDEPIFEAEAVRSWPRLSDLGTTEWAALATLGFGMLVSWFIASPRVADINGIDNITDTLIRAEAAYRSGQLTEPASDNAADHYRSVLVNDPDNPVARAGLDDIAETFLVRARAALARQDFTAVAEHLASARGVSPSHFGILAFEDVVARYQRDLLISAREAAASDMDRALGFLAQAKSLTSADDPAVMQTAAALARERRAQELDAVLQSVDERILSERLLLPEGDSAMDRLAEASSMAPDNRQVELAKDRLASALLFQAMFAIPNGNLVEAATFINAARSLNVEHLALARAEYELAKARSAEVRRQIGVPEP